MYARLLESHQLEYFTATFIRVNGITYSNPTEEILNLAGYYLVPDIPTGKMAVYWDLIDGKLVPTLEDLPPPPPVVRKISKLNLVTALKSRGLYDYFYGIIENAGVLDEWTLAQDLKDNHPLFTEHAPTIKQLLNLSDEEFEEIIEESIFQEDF